MICYTETFWGWFFLIHWKKFSKGSNPFHPSVAVPTHIVLVNQLVHLNTVDCLVCSWTITPLKSCCLPGFLKPGYDKKKILKDNTVQLILSFHKISINLQKVIHSDPYCPLKDSVWPIWSSQGFFINFHQKLMFYFHFKHLLKLESGTILVDPYCHFRKDRSTFIKKHIWFAVDFFSIILENSDQKVIQFDPNCPFKDLIYCLFHNLIKISI